MSNQMIALEARAPQLPTFADLIGIREHAQDRQAAQNAMLKKQQDDATLSNAFRQALDPATGQIDSNRLAQAMASGGLGAAIPGQQKALIGVQKDQAELGTAKITHLLKFSDMFNQQLGTAATPEAAQAAAQQLAQEFPDMVPHLAQGIQTMPRDPAQFAAWKQDVLRKNLTAAQQLQQHFQEQTTGNGVRTLAMPAYGGGVATVVPGSEGPLPPQNQFIWGANGGNLVDTRTGQARPVMEGGSSALATNPGALKDGPFAQSQPGYTGNSGGFATFSAPEHGIAAQEALLRSRYLGRGLNTVDKIVSTYAPQGPENSPASVANYKAYIAQRAGVDVNAPLTPDKVPAVAAAMREFETGHRGAAGGGQIQPKAEGIDTPIDSQSIDYVAKIYKDTGQMPPLGMGKAAAGMRAQIIARAAQMAKADGTFDTAAGIHADFKANSAALSTLQRYSSQVLASERTANANADQVLQTMGKGAGTTGVPMFNAWQNRARNNLGGDPDVARFNAAVGTFSTEYAKVVSGASGGAVTSDSARREIQAMINSAQTPQQLRAVIQQAKIEMANRKKGLNDQADALRGVLKNRPEPGGTDIDAILRKHGVIK